MCYKIRPKNGLELICFHPKAILGGKKKKSCLEIHNHRLQIQICSVDKSCNKLLKLINYAKKIRETHHMM